MLNHISIYNYICCPACKIRNQVYSSQANLQGIYHAKPKLQGGMLSCPREASQRYVAKTICCYAIRHAEP